jgi:hypothetical protein
MCHIHDHCHCCCRHAEVSDEFLLKIAASLRSSRRSHHQCGHDEGGRRHSQPVATDNGLVCHGQSTAAASSMNKSLLVVTNTHPMPSPMPSSSSLTLLGKGFFQGRHLLRRRRLPGKICLARAAGLLGKPSALSLDHTSSEISEMTSSETTSSSHR